MQKHRLEATGHAFRGLTNRPRAPTPAASSKLHQPSAANIKSVDFTDERHQSPRLRCDDAQSPSAPPQQQGPPHHDWANQDSDEPVGGEREHMWRRLGEHTRWQQVGHLAHLSADEFAMPGLLPHQRDQLDRQATVDSFRPVHVMVDHDPARTLLLHRHAVRISHSVPMEEQQRAAGAPSSVWKQPGREYVRIRTAQWDALGREFTVAAPNPPPCPQWKQYGREWEEQIDDAALAARDVSDERVVARRRNEAWRTRPPPGDSWDADAPPPSAVATE